MLSYGGCFSTVKISRLCYRLQKLGVTGVAFLVVTGLVAGVAIFSSGGSGVTIASVEYDGEDDEIDLSFYGPKEWNTH